MKFFQRTVLRYALFLGIFIGLKSLFAWKLIVDWRDVILAAVITIFSLRQSQIADKKEKEAEAKDEKLAQVEKKYGPW
jgi:hypothetical protein